MCIAAFGEAHSSPFYSGQPERGYNHCFQLLQRGTQESKRTDEDDQFYLTKTVISKILQVEDETAELVDDDMQFELIYPFD